jgi:hypothetical protein
MGVLAQELHALRLGLQSILLRVGFAQQLDGAGQHLYRLPGALRALQLPGHFQASVEADFFQQRLVEVFKIHHDLQVRHRAAVVQRDEAVGAESPHPAHDGDFLPQQALIIGEDGFYFSSFAHGLCFCFVFCSNSPERHRRSQRSRESTGFSTNWQENRRKGSSCKGKWGKALGLARAIATLARPSTRATAWPAAPYKAAARRTSRCSGGRGQRAGPLHPARLGRSGCPAPARPGRKRSSS